MNNLNVYTYHGFGDHCIAYGIIKEYSKRFDNVYLYTDLVNEEILSTRKRLYEGINNVQIMDVIYSNERVRVPDITFLGIAHRTPWFDIVTEWIKDPSVFINENLNEWRFDIKWYEQANVPFNLKWDNFDFNRNFQKEKDVFYNKLGLKDNEEFIFLHEDPSRNYIIDRKYINPNIKLIEFNKHLDINILDIMYTIERSKEAHVINSSVLTFSDLLQIKHNNLNYHKYTRSCPFEQPALKLNWNIIDE